LESALAEEGAKVQTVTNVISAFSEIERKTFDGAVIDKGLHNQAFDLCTELQSLDVPYIISSSPHDLQKPSAKIRDAKKAAASLIAAMRAGPESRDVDVSDFFEVVY
jgi:DNA-binding response OmpR family regulator